MGTPTIFSPRRIALKIFVIQFIVFQAAYAAPSPIIRFPGDDTPRTDKEVALVSLLACFPKLFQTGSLRCEVTLCVVEDHLHVSHFFIAITYKSLKWECQTVYITPISPFSTIWISFMDAHKTDATSWCSKIPWRKCKSSSLCKKLERLMPKLWRKWNNLAVVSQMWPTTTSSTGSLCGRRRTSLTGQRRNAVTWIAQQLIDP